MGEQTEYSLAQTREEGAILFQKQRAGKGATETNTALSRRADLAGILERRQRNKKLIHTCNAQTLWASILLKHKQREKVKDNISHATGKSTKKKKKETGNKKD